MEAWFTATEPNPDQIVFVAQLATQERVVELSIANGLLKTFYRDPGRHFHLGDSENVIGRHHVAIVWDGDLMSQFVDGRLIGRQGGNGTEPWYLADTTPTLALGTSVGAPGTVRDFIDAHRGQLFHGSLHALRVTSSVLYDADFTPPEKLEPTPETEALYDFSHETGSTLIDLSDHGRNGTIHGATWTSADPGTSAVVD